MKGIQLIMASTKIGFIGLGLIGGSVAKALRKYYPDYEIIAFDKNRRHLPWPFRRISYIRHALPSTIISGSAAISSCVLLYHATPHICRS